MVKSFNSIPDPNIQISRLVENFSLISEADVLVCDAKGEDICVLSQNQVIFEETLYLTVNSSVPCEYQIRIDLDQELKLFRDDFVQFKMNSTQQTQIISFEVGQLHDEEYEIQIIFFPKTWKKYQNHIRHI